MNRIYSQPYDNPKTYVISLTLVSSSLALCIISGNAFLRLSVNSLPVHQISPTNSLNCQMEFIERERARTSQKMAKIRTILANYQRIRPYVFMNKVSELIQAYSF